MIYWLLYPLAGRFPVFNVLRYPSFRMIMAGLTALLFSLLLGPWFIERLRVAQHGMDTVREDTPENHQKKRGTPSMGGLLILAALLLGTLLWAIPTSPLVWTVVTVTVGFGAVGFADDWMKFRNRSKGVPGKLKLLIEAAITAVAIYAFLTDHHLMLLQPLPLRHRRLPTSTPTWPSPSWPPTPSTPTSGGPTPSSPSSWSWGPATR